jgi:DNA-binding NarL/FixJ family response regulator
MGGVLICDDAVAYGTLFRHWLREADVGEVHHARTGAEALALAEELQPEVIVLDHLLPDSTSETLLPRLRSTVPEARVLLISGLAEDELAAAALAAGADAHIGKWATADAMRAAVTKLL